MSDAQGSEDRGPARTGEPAIRRWLLEHLSELAGVPVEEIDPTAPFSHYGVDSAAAAELMARLEDVLDRELDPTVVFSFESAAELAAYLAAGGTGHERARRTPRVAPPRAEADAHEPVAVVGIGCRFPGADGPEAYWQLLTSATDAVREVPEGRWEPEDLPADLPPHARLGGFVEGIDRFDPTFFGITQHEADRMDPQQRLLLEVAWEALEDADVLPSSLRGAPVGVFVGISANEYGRRQGADPELIDVFFGTGNALSIAANRISYALDLRGPSLAVDTACSSSLVAVHSAVAALRRGECDLALAGGANAILTPLLTLNFTNAGVIAPDGRCKTFDAAADGIVRGEGAGLVVLKPLSRAVADGDRIYCVIEGSAVNSDGRSNGLTAPNPDAQVDVFAAACADAGAPPGSVAFVEAHGTGTVLGDAMELRSLDAVYGSVTGRPAPLLVGSAKTNLGHLESAAGIAGTIKAALALHHRQVPPNLHYSEPNPFLGETEAVRVADRLQPWPDGGASRAAVSGFGFGGTNAHLVLGPAPDRAPEPAPPADPTTPLVLPLSARTEGALAAMAGRFADAVAARPEDARELSVAQALTRDEHPRRAAVAATDADELRTALDAVAAGRPDRTVATGHRRGTDHAPVAFVFSGQGRSWWPLDAGLLDDPVVRSSLEQSDSELRELADYSLMEVFRSGEPVLDHERAQPALFALQVALAARWRAFGVEPDLIIGQSIGEIAAAHVAGAIRLADGLEIVLNRGRFMEESNGTGHTAFVELPADEVVELIDRLGVEVTVAGITAPDNCLISGPKADTVTVVEAAKDRGVMAQVFAIGDIPGHGPLMGPYADKLVGAIDFLEPRPTRVPMVSTVTGEVIEGEDLDPEYWGRNLRQTVRFVDAMATAVDLGAEVFVEVAPHPVVSVSARRSLEAAASCSTRSSRASPAPWRCAARWPRSGPPVPGWTGGRSPAAAPPPWRPPATRGTSAAAGSRRPTTSDPPPARSGPSGGTPCSRHPSRCPVQACGRCGPTAPRCRPPWSAAPGPPRAGPPPRSWSWPPPRRAPCSAATAWSSPTSSWPRRRPTRPPRCGCAWTPTQHRSAGGSPARKVSAGSRWRPVPPPPTPHRRACRWPPTGSPAGRSWTSPQPTCRMPGGPSTPRSSTGPSPWRAPARPVTGGPRRGTASPASTVWSCTARSPAAAGWSPTTAPTPTGPPAGSAASTSGVRRWSRSAGWPGTQRPPTTSTSSGC
jgi:polyketide synthase 12